jgi:serine/threonine-protein kinase
MKAGFVRKGAMAEKDAGQHWEQLERLFHAALERAPAERAALLDEACARNPAQREEIEAMLKADADAEGVLDHPLPLDEYSNESPPQILVAGEQIGPWRILSELGRGGMGVVYLAERADGTYEQQVALKVIRGGLSGADMEPRFGRERRILGRLQHPNIARLIDAGASSGGWPYLVMELVLGEPGTGVALECAGLVEFGVDAVTDEATVAHVRGGGIDACVCDAGGQGCEARRQGL